MSEVLPLVVERGWCVLPVYTPTPTGECECGRSGCRAKHPRLPGGVTEASRLPYQVREWGRRWPKTGWAVRTGRRPQGSGVVVLDFDAGEPEPARARTLEATTPRGLHRYYQATDLYPSRAGVLPGVDVRAEQGYVLIPPGMGRTWRGAEMPGSLPPAWRERLAQKASPATELRIAEPSALPEGLLGCAWIRSCEARASTLSEEEWYLLASVCGAAGARELWHQLSRPYPGYSRAQAESYYRRAERARKPARCATLERFGACGGCPYRTTRLNSPATLANPLPERKGGRDR